MEENENTPTPQENEDVNRSIFEGVEPEKSEHWAEMVGQDRSVTKRGRWIFATCLLLATAILLTYTLTAAAWRRAYTEKLLEQQEIIQGMNQGQSTVADNFDILTAILESYSYYGETMDEEAMMKAAFKAYVAASGDAYAQYYTEEEYLAILQSNQAELYGLGIGVVNHAFRIEGENKDRHGFYIYDIYDGSSVADVGIKIGDFVFAVEIDGSMKTVDEIGYSAAANAIRGEAGTTVKVEVYSPSGGGKSQTYQLIRGKYESKSVLQSILTGDPTVGIVKILSFDLKTPTQFKRAIQELKQQGVTRFVFDLRDNLGGDLQSIKAVMSYFLRENDIVLEAINRKGEIAVSYRVKAITHDDPMYADCDVAAEEIGMYADLKMVVLCNESTASAAEVFVATMQDYGLAEVVGMKTFGKGIMQITRKIPLVSTSGYIKYTVYAYQTKRGESYHGVGIIPDCQVDLSEKSKEQSLLLLEQDQDEQLKTAVQRLTANQ